MAIIDMTQGDTAPALAATFTSDADGTVPVDLTGATVVFWMRAVDGTVLVDDASVTVTDASAGTVSYAWASGDTGTVGRHAARFKVTYSDGTVGHFPNYEDLVVIVHPDKS